MELGTCRAGLGDGKISFMAIVEYAKTYQIGNFEDFIYLIRKMDNKLIGLENGRKNSTTNNSNRRKNN